LKIFSGKQKEAASRKVRRGAELIKKGNQQYWISKIKSTLRLCALRERKINEI